MLQIKKKEWQKKINVVQSDASSKYSSLGNWTENRNDLRRKWEHPSK